MDKRNIKVKEYEHQIDQLVYKLYGLTEEEIKIVEGGLINGSIKSFMRKSGYYISATFVGNRHACSLHKSLLVQSSSIEPKHLGSDYKSEPAKV